MIKKICCLLFSITFMFSVFGATNKLSKNEEKLLLSNLNYLQYSICKIKNTENKAIAEEEYYSVINQIDMSSINNKELIDAYTNFLDLCSQLKLKQNEKDFLTKINAKENKNAWKNAFSSFGSVFVPGRSWKQMAISLAYTTVANIVNVENQKSNLNTQLEKDLFYLNQDQLESIYNGQTYFFNVCMNLLGGKDIKGRILENTMNNFILIKNNDNANEKITLLTASNIQENLENFPPYWYELGNAYQQTGDIKNAMLCYDHFEQLKSYDVMKKDNNYINVLKNKINIYLGLNGKSSNLTENVRKNKKSVLKCINLINENTLDSNIGEIQAYLSKIYFLIDETDKAEECINYIINTKSINSEYLDDAVNLRLLIKSSDDSLENIPYRNALKYKSISFDNEGYEVTKKSQEGFKKLLSNITGFVSNFFFNSDELFYFNIPSIFVSDKDLLIQIDDKVYIPTELAEKDGNKLFYIDYKTSDINDGTKICFNIMSKTDNSEDKVYFTIMPVKDSEYEAAAYAFERMGTNINLYNAEISLSFGKLLNESKYKYHVKNIEKKREALRKEIIKAEKDSNETPLTNLQIEQQLKKDLAEELSVDVENLTQIFADISEEYYSKKTALFNSQIVNFYGKNYIVGIDSIYDSNIDNIEYFNPYGDVLPVTKNEENNIPVMLEDLYKKAAVGDISSCIDLGTAFYNGTGTEKNYSEAVKWLFKGVTRKDKKDLNNTEKLKIITAYKYISECYREGFGVSKNKDTAELYLNMAKDLENN